MATRCVRPVERRKNNLRRSTVVFGNLSAVPSEFAGRGEIVVERAHALITVVAAEDGASVGATATAAAGVAVEGVADLGAGTFKPVSGVR